MADCSQTKPANLGAPQPMNTLSNNSATSRTFFGVPSSSRSLPPSPPPAKRQKLDENNTSSGYSRATFVVNDPATPRKRSIESLSVTDSQRSVASNMSTSKPGVAEYRSVDTWTKSKRPRKRGSNTRFPVRAEDVENPTLRPTLPQKSAEDVSEDEVDLLDHQKAQTGLIQLKRKQPEERPISEYSNRFKEGRNPDNYNATHIFSKVIDDVDKKTKPRGYATSPDELAPSLEEIAASRPAKRLKQFSPSLSKRGNILSTNFRGAPKSSTIMSTDYERMDKQKEKACTIIGGGLRIVRGASGRCQYQADYKDDPEYCFLAVRQIGHTLYPVDKGKDFLKPYKYLTLDIKKANSIIRSTDNEERCIVIVNSDVNISNGSGPKLMIEFASRAELFKFLQWVDLYRDHDCPIIIKDGPMAKLEKDFDEMIRRTESHKLHFDDEIQGSDADDIKVIRHNQNNRVLGPLLGPHIAAESKNRPKLRDTMGILSPSRPNSDGHDTTLGQARYDQPASAQQQTRTTRSTFAFIDSPEPEPIPEGWTSLNAGWEKQWRNSLVYPDTGKNRATVDKDDIQRLDEGQFLNDNIIIFYLRYLQKNLEDSNQDLATRIYFQNTFFYDKLKPTRAGQGINFDSVKTWTSKVDLFSKDYIIVPINEYSHWYVAIICNAPKFLPSPDSHKQDDDTKSDVIAIPDDVEATPETPQASSQNGVLNGCVDGEHVAPPAQEITTQEVTVQEEVAENLRRMSIDSSSDPRGGAERTPDDKAGEGADPLPPRRGHEVCVIKDADGPTAEVEHIATSVNPQARKKIGRKSVGPRKYDPTQPRIITLDSLGAPHSPTCTYLKQYLVAELKDKRGLEIQPPGAMGTTAKDIPEQTNHCDCGLFLLGYIQQFLQDPDLFVESLLQRDGRIPWYLNPSELRKNIRDLIFTLQREQQNAEDVAQEQKRQTKMSKNKGKAAETVDDTTAPATDHSDTVSKPELDSHDHGGDKEGTSQTASALPNTRPPSPRDNNTGVEEVVDPRHLLGFERSVKQAINNVQPPAPSVRNDGLRTTRHTEMDGRSNVEEIEARSKASPHVVASPRKPEPIINHKIPGTFPISPVRTQAVKCYSPSSETESSTNLPSTFLGPLASGTPSSKGSRGATPLDPVILDDSDNRRRGRAWQSPQKHGGGRSRHQLVVEIPSTAIDSESPGQAGKKDGRKETEQQSPYFPKRRDGERVTAVKLREKPRNDVIDLSD
ncbi:hypothetical protein EKO27_g3948 [Xylaria grammica]|uniref:Ubiquitin-like protease family profile domain-containing protein n=1 Tax=Xylaria grammica TaxID=363999 RepID=A0A439D9W6_9PEZI|nr:hypothetical protein EKO27_g3948 [Xylaria grammica]